MRIVSKGQDNWNRKDKNYSWARERMRGQILPLEPVKGASWFKRLWGRV